MHSPGYARPRDRDLVRDRNDFTLGLASPSFFCQIRQNVFLSLFLLIFGGNILTSGNHLEFLPNPLKLRELFNDT